MQSAGAEARCFTSAPTIEAGIVHNPASHYGQHRFDVFDLIGWNAEIVAIKHNQVRQFARLDRAEICSWTSWYGEVGQRPAERAGSSRGGAPYGFVRTGGEI